jgi:hypothetical protein
LWLRNAVPEHRPAAVRPNSGEPPAGTGRARAGIDPRVLGSRFLGSVGQGETGEVGAPASSGGGCRDRCAGEVAILWGRRAGRRAWVGAREGGGGFVWTCGRPKPKLAAAASNCAAGGSGRGWKAREEFTRSRLLYSGSVPLCCAERRTEGRPRAELEGAGSKDEQTDRRTGDPSSARPATQREEGKTSRRPRDVRGFGERA